MKPRGRFPFKLMGIKIPVEPGVTVYSERIHDEALAAANRLSATPVEGVEYIRVEEDPEMGALVYVYAAWGTPKEDE